MKPLPPLSTLWRPLLALGLAGLLSACGPGVGGTGTGQTHGVADFGATAGALCASSLADSLSCPPPTDGARPQVGSQPLLLADAVPPLRATGRIDGNLIELNLPCDGWSFLGEWGLAARAPDGRFYGTGRGPGGRVQPAVLHLQALGNGQFLATLQDANAQALVPPVALQTVPSAGAAPSCSA